MKRKVTALTLLLCFVMLCSCGRAVESPASGSSDAQTGTELVEITFVNVVDPTFVDQTINKLPGETFEDNRWTRLIEEELGYKITYKWLVNDWDQYNQKFNAAMAAGDLPDVVTVNGRVQLKQLISAGLVIDIKDIYETYASPLLKEILQSDSPNPVTAATVDGVWYGFPYVVGDIEYSSLLWVREDWREKSGLAVPRTIDEMADMIEAFIEFGGEDAVGFAINKGLFGNNLGITGLIEAYGGFYNIWVERDGKLAFSNVLPEFKLGMAKAAEFYDRGFFDIEFTVKDQAMVNEGIIAGKNGIFYGPHYASLNTLKQCRILDPEADWYPHQIPTADGSPAKVGLRMGTNNWYVVSKNTKTPEAFIKLMNLYVDKTFDPVKQEYEYYSNPAPDINNVWMLSPVRQYTPNKNVNITRKIADNIKNNDPGDLFGESYAMWDNVMKGLAGDVDYYGWMRIYGPKGSCELQGSYLDGNQTVRDMFFGAPTATMETHFTIINDAFIETMVQIVIGQRPVDDYDKAVQEWLNAGGQKITDEVNEWYAANK